MSRVLVLRDREAAGETVRELARRGHEAVLLPVQEIAPSGEPPPVGDFACICVTSRNAVPALRRYFHGTRKPLLAVGGATAAALREAGFRHVEAGGNEAAGLVGPAAGHAARAAGGPVLLALGRRRTAALEDGLAAAGVPFVVWETYETRLLRPGAVEAREALGDTPPDAVLLLSGSQAEGFAALACDHPDLFGSLPRLFCLSARIAGALPAELRAAALISPTPDLSALFDGLTRTNFRPYCLAGSAGETRKTG